MLARYGVKFTPWRLCLLGTIALASILFFASAGAAQQPFISVPAIRIAPPVPLQSVLAPAPSSSFVTTHRLSTPVDFHGFSLDHSATTSLLLNAPAQNFTPGTIERWEAAFSCNDTPFVDQVRFPFATLWGGRLKLTTIESDVTTANFVLGLPGAGTLPNLNMFGSGHLAAIHTPASDQLVAMHMTFTLRGGEVKAGDNSGLRGVQYVVRAGRDFLQSFSPR